MSYQLLFFSVEKYQCASIFDSVSSCFQTKHPISVVFVYLTCSWWCKSSSIVHFFMNAMRYLLLAKKWNLDLSRNAVFRVKKKSAQHPGTHRFRCDIGPQTPLPSHRAPLEPLTLRLPHLHFPTRLQPTGNQVNLCNPTLTFSEKMSHSTQLIYFIMLWLYY